MREWATFLGRFHPVWVHLPIGILLLLAVLELIGLLSRFGPFQRLPALAPSLRAVILWLGAASAVLATFLGWLLARTGGYAFDTVSSHETLGFLAAALLVVLVAVRRVPALYGPIFAVALAVLVLAAHAGAKLTHGGDYLTERLPRRFARAFGIAPPAPPAPRVVTVETALVYPDVIQPILNERCIACHGPSKSNGGLRLDSWDALARGGKHGSVVKSGDLAASLLVHRIRLPEAEKEHMPPKGRPQLTDDDVTLLEWWVSAGVPRSTRVSALEPAPAAAVILEDRLAAANRPPDRAATLAAAEKIAGALGILIRSDSPDGPWLDVNARPAGKAFADRNLDDLSSIAPAIQSLDLGGTAVTDAGLGGLRGMSRLERLHLDGLPVTDAGLASVAGLRRLAYLNLRGTKVTDAGLGALKGLARLRAVYAWQTAVTPEGLKALSDAVVDPRRVARWKTQEADLDREIAADRFEGNVGEALKPVAKPKPTPNPPKTP